MTSPIPGVVTPLRGLESFTAAERDVFPGRDREREELSRLVTADGFRAGLVYGEPGVGKTSLLRAGLVPHLRDHGVYALYVNDSDSPIAALVETMTELSGVSPDAGEKPAAFMARVIAEAMSGQVFLFLVDESELLLRDPERAGELGDLFARVAARGAGRARFLFACATGRIHLFGELEKRTGSLFPPSARYPLERFPEEVAEAVLVDSFAVSAPECEPELARRLAHDLTARGPVLPADLQIAVRVVREQNIYSVNAYTDGGGLDELERKWLEAIARQTGNEKSAIRLLAELDHRDGRVPSGAAAAAARAGVSTDFAKSALPVLVNAGLVSVAGEGEPSGWVLAHEVLGHRVRELAAQARATARRSFELLGRKAKSKESLTVREWREIRREGIVPGTPEEQAVMRSAQRRVRLAIGTAIVLPIAICVAAWMSMSGQYYLDVVEKRVVARHGRAGLSMFHWLPGGFGEVIADLGVSQSVASPAAWQSIDEAGGATADIAETYRGLLSKEVNAAWNYAVTGEASALADMQKLAQTTAGWRALLDRLSPIARGGEAEHTLVREALGADSLVVQKGALELAIQAERRLPGSYEPVLLEAMRAPNPERKALAAAAVRGLPMEQGAALFAKVGVEATKKSDKPSLTDAISALREDAADAGARRALQAALAKETDWATVSRVLADVDESPGVRKALFEVLAELPPLPGAEALSSALTAARGDTDPEIRALALPLQARATPDVLEGELALMQEQRSLPPAVQVAMARAWGELARLGKTSARSALSELLTGRRLAVRAAAARAYGHAGRTAQPELAKLVRQAPFPVAVGAANGLVDTLARRGSAGTAAQAIAFLFRTKGRSRRAAAQAFARLAEQKPAVALRYLAQAAADTKDRRLREIGADGVCRGVANGHAPSRRALVGLAASEDPAVRRIAAKCVADHPGHARTRFDVAARLRRDPAAPIRLASANALASLLEEETPPKGTVGALLDLAADGKREVRSAAVRGLGKLRRDVPERVGQALLVAFRQGVAEERVEALSVARALGIGLLVGPAAKDPSAAVREAALDTAIATGTDVTQTMSAALTDADATLRLAALARLGQGPKGMDEADVQRAVELALRDRAVAVQQAALETLARRFEPTEVRKRLSQRLGSPSEAVRAQAAAAAIGLVEREPTMVIELLSPVIDERSHDVRVAALRPLAFALARTQTLDALLARLSGAETNATWRLVSAVAIADIAKGDGKDAVAERLTALAGPPLAKETASLLAGLIRSKADAASFLQAIVP